MIREVRRITALRRQNVEVRLAWPVHRERLRSRVGGASLPHLIRSFIDSLPWIRLGEAPLGKSCRNGGVSQDRQAARMLVHAYVTRTHFLPASNLAPNRSDVGGSSRVLNTTQGNGEDQH